MASTCPKPQQFVILMLHAHPRVWQGGSQSPLCLGAGEKGIWGLGLISCSRGCRSCLGLGRGKMQQFGSGFTVPHFWWTSWCAAKGVLSTWCWSMSEEEEAAAKVEGGGNENCPGYFSSQDVLCLFVLSCLWLMPSADANTKQGWGLGWRTVCLPAIQSSTSSVAGMRKIFKAGRKYLDFTRGKYWSQPSFIFFF